MKSRQAGFTLVEIAIVLVIIGLLLGGVLKGQELINSAKVKNMATDFRNVPLFIYGYQDKFKALPGDHHTVVTALSGTLATTPTSSGNPAVACTNPSAGATCTGNGVIDGVWNTTTTTDETALFWNHVRLAGLAAGPTLTSDANYFPTNADGGRIGIESGAAATGGAYIQNGTVVTATGVVTALATPTYFSPTYLVCSSGILGKYAKQLDTTLDDGETATGSVRVVAANHVRQGLPIGTGAINDSSAYIVCMGL
ncbi:MAG: prepilin-type N-terminal cleavage/methylation domain-containing protein [Rhodocyclales bacterium]|nr:prepilin-type N-terminal cleavage/methylation domain-containing protein [Rhodocyclales bacterium]